MTTQATTITPVPGMGAYVAGYSDVHSYTIIAVSKNGKAVTAQRDHSKLLNGATSGEPDALQCSVGGFCAHVSGTQRWELTPNPNGTVYVFTLRKNGKFVKRHQSQTGEKLVPGKRVEHYDFNF